MAGAPRSNARPLHVACRKKSYTDTLESCDTDNVNVRDQGGLFPLMLVLLLPLTRKNVEEILAIIAFLILKGANVNCQDCDGNTVLHQIANLLHRVTDDKNVIMPILRLLTKHGADPSIKNRWGKTCYRIAYARQARKAGDFLRSGYKDYADGKRNQRSELVQSPVYENIRNQITLNPYNEIDYSIYPNNGYNYVPNATCQHRPDTLKPNETNDVNARDQNDLTAQLYVDGGSQNQQPQFFHQPIYENIESYLNPCNGNLTKNDCDFFAKASAPLM